MVLIGIFLITSEFELLVFKRKKIVLLLNKIKPECDAYHR